MNSHPETDYSLDELAAMANLSPWYFLRQFRLRYGMPPHAWLIQARLRKARQLLQNGDRPADVSLQCGFTDQSHFTRHFKRAMGVSPANLCSAADPAEQFCTIFLLLCHGRVSGLFYAVRMITMTTTTDLPASPLKDFLTGALHMTPLNLAVVPWAILAGSMAVDSGLTFAQSVAMSAMVFAGAAQLVTLGLLNSGAG